MAWVLIFLVAAIPWGISVWTRAEHDRLAIGLARDRIRQDLDGILSHTLRLAGPASFLQDRAAWPAAPSVACHGWRGQGSCSASPIWPDPTRSN